MCTALLSRTQQTTTPARQGSKNGEGHPAAHHMTAPAADMRVLRLPRQQQHGAMTNSTTMLGAMHMSFLGQIEMVTVTKV